MDELKLGEIARVNPRKKWLNEARDFTPWLAENIETLAKAVGLELEVENTEVSVGPYSADILAKDIGTDRYVVIENQLEKTDHDHLGKAITYASVLNASTIIWIATEFSDEHQRALEWLNDNSTDEIMFFGVQLELWQIDDSRPAVRFHIISKPNQAVRQAVRSKGNEELSETKKFQLNFWERFREKLVETKKIPSLQTPAAQSWYEIRLGKSHIQIVCRCNTYEKVVKVCVYVSNKIADTMFPFLESRKEEIETAIGQPLQWNPAENTIDKVIVLQKSVNFTDPNEKEKALDWMVEYAVKFRTVIAKIIRDYP